MPELPEVETMRRGIAVVAGCAIRDLWRPRSRLRPITIRPRFDRLRAAVVGRTIVEVGRVGKRVVLVLDSGDRLTLEPRMTGRVLLAEPSESRHTRVVFALSGGGADRLIFWDQRGLGLVRLFSAARFDREFGPDRIGPDALSITVPELQERLGASRRAIKVALLDQRGVAGIGNLYASEILHRVGLHPATPCNRLAPADWERLRAAIVEVLEEALAHQGSTLGDGTYRNVQDESGGFQECHRVYGREGEPCLGCGRGVVVRVVQAQRSTFLCPRCQTLPRA